MLLIYSLCEQLKPALDKLNLLFICVVQVFVFVFFEVESVPLMDIVLTTKSAKIIVLVCKMLFVLSR